MSTDSPWRRAGPYIIVAVAAIIFLFGRYLNRQPVRMIEREAPRFVLPVLGEEGTEVDSAHLRGRVLALLFWQCRNPLADEALKFWDQAFKKYQDQGLFVLGISMENNPKAALAHLDELGITIPQADGVAQLAAGGVSGVKAYEPGVPGLPTAFLIDRDGWIRHHHIGWQDGSAEKCREWIERLLKEPVPSPPAATQPVTTQPAATQPAARATQPSAPD